VNFSCDFHSPAYIDDLLTIYCWADTIGGASIKLRFAVERDSVILGDGSCTIVSVDRINRKAVKIPDVLRSALKKIQMGKS
jgi:acyl-CoA thioesterase FadM